jgi:hypothetical protein
MDPALRERRPRMVIDENGKERLSVEGKLLGNPRGGSAASALSVSGKAPSSSTASDMSKGVRAALIRARASSTWISTGSTPLSSTRASVCPFGPGRLYRPAQDHMGDGLSALRRVLPGAPQMIRERLEPLSPEAIPRGEASGIGRACDGVLRPAFIRGRPGGRKRFPGAPDIAFPA